MYGNKNIFDQSQLTQKDIVKSAINLHYGYVFNPVTNAWEKGAKARQLPDFGGAMEIKPIAIYHRQHIGVGNLTLDAFHRDRANSGGKMVTNQPAVVLENDAIRLFAGMQIRSEAAAAPAAANPTDAEIAALDFDPVAELAILNGEINLSLNSQKVYENHPIKAELDNTDSVTNFMRFNSILVQEPGTKIEMDFVFPAAPGAIWLETVLLGWELKVSRK